MKREDKKLLAVFITLVIIIIAGFAATIYYIDTKYLPKASEGEEGTILFAKAFADESIGAAPLNVTFSSLLLNYEGATKYYWDFGDGNISTEKNPTYNYTREGEYTCNLTVTDDSGKIATASINILVTANKPPQVVVLVTPTESNRPYIPGLNELSALPGIGDKLIVGILKASPTSSNLFDKKSWINCDGQIFDPEGDEIVSYKWELQQPAITFLGSQDWPKFYFEGKI